MILFTDRLILGQFHDAALASMQVSGPVLWSIFSLFGAYGVGVLAVIGRATGEKNVERVQTTMGTALCVALALGTFVGLIGHLATPQITESIIGDVSILDAKDMANVYLGAVFLSGPAMMLTAVNFTAFQASGDTRTPMWLTGIGGGVNLIVSWVLVFGSCGAPQLGILGAAVGTISSSILSALLGLYMLSKSPIRPRLPRWSALRSIMRVAWPALGEKILFHTGFLIFTAYVGRLGETAMTAHQGLMAIESLGFIAASGFGIAAAAIVAQKLGARDPQAAEIGVQIAIKLGLITLCTIGLFFLSSAEWLMGLFTRSHDIINLGAQCMIIAAISQPLMVISDVYAGALRGAGDTQTPMKVALVGPLAIRLGACWLFAYWLDMGLLGIWIGSTLDWLVRSIWLWLVFRRGHWKTIEV
jgi:putative MATE family efflux protein